MLWLSRQGAKLRTLSCALALACKQHLLTLAGPLPVEQASQLLKHRPRHADLSSVQVFHSVGSGQPLDSRKLSEEAQQAATSVWLQGASFEPHTSQGFEPRGSQAAAFEAHGGSSPTQPGSRCV